MKKFLCAISVTVSLLFLQTPFVSAQLPAMSTDTTTADTAEVSPPDDEVAMPVGPSIGSVSVTDITDTSARIDVDSDEMVQGYVEYGTTEQYGMSTPLSSEFSVSPSFVLENLTPETLYHYRVIVMDSGGNAAITNDETFTTLATPEEPAPPPPTDSQTATTTTTTDTADSTDSATTTTTTTNTADNTGSATTTSPTASTTPQTSTTPAPAFDISDTETRFVSTSTARIVWQTNKSANARVEYGTVSTYGAFTPVGPFSSSHSVHLSGLMPNTKYYYRALSQTVEGEMAESAGQAFTTLAFSTPPTPPVISALSVTAGTSAVTISWTTSKPATSDIHYGPTTSYGLFLGKNTEFKTNHVRTIENLKAGTLYRFRIIVVDSAQNTTLGRDRTFTTTALTVPVIEPVSESEPKADLSEDDSRILAEIDEQQSSAVSAPNVGVGGLPVAPLRPLLVKVTPLDSAVSFEWRKDRGTKNGIIKTLIVRKEGTEGVRSRIDGRIIYNGAATTFTDTNVQNGKEYHYALYSYGTRGRFTFPATFKVVPRAEKQEVYLSAKEVREEKVVPPAFAGNLFQGKQGDSVRKLQAFLAENGYYPEMLVTGYFGPLTRAAVVRFQKLNGITPAAGFVGPITREAISR